jgi:hypothetical protein
MTDVVVLLDALRRWRAHENDNDAASSTLLAVFGVRSSLGYLADRALLSRPSVVGSWLHNDICDYCDYKVLINEANAAYELLNGTMPRAETTIRMLEYGLQRKTDSGHAHQVPLTPEAQAALVMYFRKEIELLREITPLVCKGGDTPWQRHRKVCRQRTINSRIRAAESALKAIEGAGVCPGPATVSEANHAMTDLARTAIPALGQHPI